MNIEPNENQKRWQTIIEYQIASGQPQIKWCEEHDVNIHNFRYWKRRFVSHGDGSFVRQTTPALQGSWKRQYKIQFKDQNPIRYWVLIFFHFRSIPVLCQVVLVN